LQRRFNRADVDGNGKLDHHEAESIPWLAHNFKRLDFNEDNVITLEELWDLQRALAPRHHNQHHPPHHHKSPNHKRGHHYYDDRQNHLGQEN
jgi:Ca2+-binding EF-hand superfamily protein